MPRPLLAIHVGLESPLSVHSLSFLSWFSFVERGKENLPQNEFFLFIPTEPLKPLEKKGKTLTIGDHQPYTATTKDFGSKKGFQQGVVYELSEPKRTAKCIYHHQDCTGDVLRGFCGGGAQIVGFEITAT